MNRTEKTFAIDLMRALDVSMESKTQTIEQYENDLHGETKKQVLLAVRDLISGGYTKVSTNKV